MRVVRVAWFVLAAPAALLTVRFAFGPVADLSRTCAKGGQPDEFGAQAGATCRDTTVTAFGVAQVTRPGVLLTVPPIIAGLVMRWVPWSGYVGVDRGQSICADPENGAVGRQPSHVGLVDLAPSQARLKRKVADEK